MAGLARQSPRRRRRRGAGAPRAAPAVAPPAPAPAAPGFAYAVRRYRSRATGSGPTLTRAARPQAPASRHARRPRAAVTRRPRGKRQARRRRRAASWTAATRDEYMDYGRRPEPGRPDAAADRRLQRRPSRVPGRWGSPGPRRKEAVPRTAAGLDRRWPATTFGERARCVPMLGPDSLEREELDARSDPIEPESEPKDDWRRNQS